jgi:hypothetical protein
VRHPRDGVATIIDGLCIKVDCKTTGFGWVLIVFVLLLQLILTHITEHESNCRITAVAFIISVCDELAVHLQLMNYVS